MNSDAVKRDVVEILRKFSQALSMAALYALDHPRVASMLPDIVNPVQRLLATVPEITVIVLNDDLLFEGKPLVREAILIKLAKHFNRRGVGHITFLPGLDIPILFNFISALQGTGELNDFKGGVAGIRIGAVTVAAGEDDGAVITAYRDLSPEQLQGLQSLYESIAAHQSLDSRQVISLVAGFIKAFNQEINPLLALTPIRNMDEYTFTHSINVGILNIAQGMSLGISAELLHDLGVAGMLHDAGKIFIDRAIIQKPGALSDEEFAVMKTHPVRGAQYLMGQTGVPKLAVISAFEHHMRYDCTGYPQPPEEWSLNLCSQMTMISDTFDALRTRRIYKDPWDFPVVCGHMLALVGTQLNEDLTLNFLDMLARMGDSLPPAQLDDAVPARTCYCE